MGFLIRLYSKGIKLTRLRLAAYAWCWTTEEDLKTNPENAKRVAKWLTVCLLHPHLTLRSARDLKNDEEREVWACKLEMNGSRVEVFLSIFKPGLLKSVNTSLPPDQAARKCALAMAEMPAFGIPTPRVLGHATVDREGAVVCEKVERVDLWTSHVRIQAAKVLSRIHTLQESSLSKPLRELASISDPREFRTTGGKAPQPETKTLVHGDYFSANILPVADGLRVIDWETFGWGDPMWDLGFLIGADRGLEHDEVEAVIAEYESSAAVDRQRLMWHSRRWSDYWKQQERKSSNKTDAGHA